MKTRAIRAYRLVDDREIFLKATYLKHEELIELVDLLHDNNFKLKKISIDRFEGAIGTHKCFVLSSEFFYEFKEIVKKRIKGYNKI